MKTYRDIYTQHRKDFWAHPERYGRGVAKRQLASAKREADIRARWDSAGDLVRLDIRPDGFCNMADLLGDTFDPDVNHDIPAARLEREKQAEVDRINRDGVWGVVGQYKCPCCSQWVEADSCWGFVGDDWRTDGSDLDIMYETLDQLEQSRVSGHT